MKKVLVPGGGGFIGSHTLLALQAKGYHPITLDNFSNGHASSILAGEMIEGDIRDEGLLDEVFTAHEFDAVVHFAAFIEAGESVVDPLAFYENNVGGSLTLLKAMLRHGVNNIVFSSTAAVYGQPVSAEPLTENSPNLPINPYGQSKWAVECMLRDTAAAHGIRAVALRYFNAAGADPDNRIGERHEPETHLIPLVLQAASGKRASISIFGTDYETPDGTCIRDYIHVDDLASAHVLALDKLFNMEHSCKSGAGFYEPFNLGTGNGFSVRQVIDMCRRVTGVDFTVIEEQRRPGDPAFLVADAERARKTLGWQPRHPDLEDMVSHAWHFLRNR